ncbi:hypothetical protein [Ekhidna sp.]|uniref:hypothetical protein n=1 Tax=Ekhidna sp. TaxID=2608089 RepID=UPI003B510ED1
MKKILNLVLALVITLTSSSCGDDDEGPDFITPFVGTWQANSLTATGCNNSEDNGTFTCDPEPYCLQITIESDGSYTLMEAGSQTTETGSISATATRLNICENGSDCDDAQYSFNGSNSFTVIITDDADSDTPGCTNTLTFTKQ